MLISLDQLITKYNMNITGVIHIGAHYGEEVDGYISNGIENIVMFEPLKSNFNVLVSNIINFDKNIITHQVALGNDNRTVEMYISSNEMQSSSILKPKKHLTHHPNVYFTGIEEVQMKKLDCFNYSKFNFINMDVQGYELEVLKGGKKTLEFVNYVYCEVNRDEVYENNAFIGQIDEFLSDYNMERVETDWSGDIWGDALYIKN